MAAFAPVPTNRNQKIKSQPVGKNSQQYFYAGWQNVLEIEVL
ncbi:hypothetical protein EUBHAL_02652 [Anaerobutyricum hallii DSM 3353]|uniref:Uncharacterized protein n=1 Tax=Anaerobutyricum hallii DSM 3353 TaxID=411469 RepID=C0EYZ7_9FIRM|nr:hypothetical protein EUBHAL_02652 [Anaerobutyricum hallii DSM 3353]